MFGIYAIGSLPDEDGSGEASCEVNLCIILGISIFFTSLICLQFYVHAYVHIYTYKCDNMTMFLFVICPLIATNQRPNIHPKWFTRNPPVWPVAIRVWELPSPAKWFFPQLVIGKIEEDLTNETLEVLYRAILLSILYRLWVC